MLSLGLVGTTSVFAQEAKEVEKKTEKTETTEKPSTPAPAQEPAKTEAEKTAAPVDAPPPTVPKEVEEKLELARRAVAEAIVAAEDAGLVDTSIDPPPILDILVQGYAIDAKTLKNPAAKKTVWSVSPEVFCGWFTGYNKSLEGLTINPQTELRIINPSAGLKAFYDQRANILNRHIEEVRKAKGPAPAPAVTPAPETKPAAETKPAEEAKPEEKKDEAKPDEAKPEEKKDEAPKNQ
jgi:hypothetical protein